MNLLSTFLRSLLFVLAWLPRQGIAWLRSRILHKRPVVKMTIGGSGLGSKAQFRLLSLLDRMAKDEEIKAVLIELRSLKMGYATIQQFVHALERIQASGKLVLVQMDAVGLRDLTLSSVADRSWLSPMAELHLSGVGATIPFYGDALSRLGVGVELLSAGAYKSFGEPYSRAWPTSQNREQLESLLRDLQSQIVESISKGRGVDAAVIEQALGQSPLSAEQAVEMGLVDGIAYADQVRDQIRELLDLDADPLPLRPYRWLSLLLRWLEELSLEQQWIPVIHLKGPVVMSDAEGGSGPKIAAERVVPVLERLAKDDDCKAVVLAVTSPGGSALASDLIARAIRKLMEKRPVVAWFGDVSASGGYYISAPASEIVANPGSITGSIGVVGGKIVIGGAVAQAGIHHETVAAGPDTTMMGPWDGFSPDQRRRFRQSLIRVYDRFLQVVSSGRKMPERSVLEVAEGRVWTGRQAMERGLVDHLGGLETALDRAQSLAGLGELPLDVEHIRFSASRLKTLQSMSSDSRSGPLGLLEGLWMASGGVLISAVWRHPMQPLMVLPWELTDRSD